MEMNVRFEIGLSQRGFAGGDWWVWFKGRIAGFLQL